MECEVEQVMERLSIRYTETRLVEETWDVLLECLYHIDHSQLLKEGTNKRE